VSHDRYFIDKLATRIFEIADGEVRVFPGNYEDYLWRKEHGGADPASPVAYVPTLDDVPRPDPGKASASLKRINPIKLKQLTDRAAWLEARSAELEGEIASLEAALLNFVSAEQAMTQSQQLEAFRSELESVLAEWEQTSLQIEEAR
jgi:ATP-binding cassette subfamily F protein 3